MKRRIFDKDIDVIVSSVVTFMREEEVYYKKRGLTFAEFFKVVFVVRDTTSKMLTTDVHEDYYQNHCSSINISNWYRAEEIYENKLEYFKNLLIFAYPSSDFFQLIIEDGQSGAPTSIMKQVSCMYNQNKRRITRILARVAGVFDHQRAHPELNHGVLTYEQFKSIWDKNAKDYAKFLCRQAILRLVFNEISKTGYFKRISGHSTSIPDEKRTYARRILTFLANERVLEGNWDNDYVGFYKLTKNVFCSLQISNENITIEIFKGIAEILIALDEFRFSPESEILSENTSDSGNRWCQLVTLKMNDINPTQNDTVDMLATQMLKEYEKQSDNNRNKFGVKITDAGYFFAKQLCYFEFFASQCDNRSTPLIFMTEVEHIKDTIRKVYQYSEQYINNALNFEYNFFHGKIRAGHQINYYLRHISNEGNVSYQPLAYRIIFRHCDYLRAYKQYIDDETTQRKNNVFSANERSSLSRYINLYIEKYRDLYDKIDGPSYMINDKTEISHYFSNYFKLPSLWKENSIPRTSLKQE